MKIWINDEHSENEKSFKEVTDKGIVISVSDEHPLKRLSLITFNEVGIEMFSIKVHLENTNSSIDIIEEGILISFKDEQL